ncbi:28S ribosomal protein S31, mitochondrial [Photinus pyralis]|uniref:28S ribosomal protein S31, mitochondrial n=1 Tax=Photinus pyralis TaxID=7054 RepID=UPI0012673417|nr:28S ribosomal protein S31, mitochondrial [Photinus pyralis]
MMHFTLLRCRPYATKAIRAAFSTKRGDTSTSSSSSDSDDDRKLKRQERSEAARQKLHLLLENMLENDTTTKEKGSDLPLTKARDHRRIAKERREEESVKTETVEKKIVKAVQDVSVSLGGDVKKTESELLQKLLGGPAKEDSQQPTVTDLNELFKDMKIDRETKTDVEISRAEQVRQLLQMVKPQPAQTPQTAPRRRPQVSSSVDIPQEPVNLHVEECLGIFNGEEVKNWEEPELNPTWRALHRRELELSVTHPPENYFQQMILWTKQGKVWKFPIDNEQDLETEKDVYFTEHIFLEKHLEGWCPPRGPIRHFMELVCVGLSKNAYQTAEMKRDHILWFRDYFKEKNQLLVEVGAFPPGFEIGKGGLKVEAK